MGIQNWVELRRGGVPTFSRFFCRRPLYKVDQISSLFLLHLHSIFSVPHPPHSHRLRHHCLYLLPLKCRRLQVTQSTFGIHVRKQQFGFRWQWTAFLSAGSTAGYVYFYSFYYFFFKTKMYGFFQTTFYFGYMGVFSLGLGMLCGTVSDSLTWLNF